MATNIQYKIVKVNDVGDVWTPGRTDPDLISPSEHGPSFCPLSALADKGWRVSQVLGHDTQETNALILLERESLSAHWGQRAYKLLERILNDGRMALPDELKHEIIEELYA